MHRTFAAAAVTALTLSTLALAPAPEAQQDTTHAVVFTEDGSATIDGGLPGGVNLTPFLGEVGIEQSCTPEPTGYCETILIEIQQPVEDLDPDVFEIGRGQYNAELTPQIAASDFDVYVYESDASGTRGDDITFSAGFPAVDDCGASTGSECVAGAVSTYETLGTRYVLVEVYYFASAGSYTMDISYSRTS